MAALRVCTCGETLCSHTYAKLPASGGGRADCIACFSTHLILCVHFEVQIAILVAAWYLVSWQQCFANPCTFVDSRRRTSLHVISLSKVVRTTRSAASARSSSCTHPCVPLAWCEQSNIISSSDLAGPPSEAGHRQLLGYTICQFYDHLCSDAFQLLQHGLGEGEAMATHRTFSCLFANQG